MGKQLHRHTPRKPLFPVPPRACSRQTGVIVYRNYDMGENPYDQTHAHKALRSQVKLPNLPRYRQGTMLAERIVRPVGESADRLVSQLPSLQKEEMRREQRREVVERSKKQHVAKEVHEYHPSKVDQLISKVLTLGRGKGDDDAPRIAGLMPTTPQNEALATANHRSVSSSGGELQTEVTTMTGLRMLEEDPSTTLTLDQYRSDRQEFNRYATEGKFFGALSMGSDLIFKGNLIPIAELRKCVDITLEVDFSLLMASLHPQISEAHMEKLHAAYMAEEKARREQTTNFREKFDISTVRDIERCFSHILEKFSTKVRVSKLTGERGVVEEEYVKYAESSGIMVPTEQLRKTFQEVAVQSKEQSLPLLSRNNSGNGGKIHAPQTARSVTMAEGGGGAGGGRTSITARRRSKDRSPSTISASPHRRSTAKFESPTTTSDATRASPHRVGGRKTSSFRRTTAEGSGSPARGSRASFGAEETTGGGAVEGSYSPPTADLTSPNARAPSSPEMIITVDEFAKILRRASRSESIDIGATNSLLLV